MNYPKVSIWSLFRDDAGDNLKRYQDRIYKLDYPADLLRFYFVEGDSVDDTWKELVKWTQQDKRVNIVRRETGFPRQSHTAHPIRVKTLAWVGNAALRILANDKWGELACLIESDLIFNEGTLRQLVEHRPDNGVIAPMVWIPGPNLLQFYDVWAYRFLSGDMFPPNRPEWFVRLGEEPFEIYSAGSMLLLPAEPIYDGVRYTDELAVRGICAQYRERGYKIYADPGTDIFHPIVLNPYEQMKPDLKPETVNESKRKLKGLKQWA